MHHIMNLDQSPFEMIENGDKTIELRLNDEKRQLIKIGDEIEFISTTDSQKTLLRRVIDIHQFNSFEDLYRELPLLKCGYTDSNIDTAKASDMDIYYSNDKQKNYGVIGIKTGIFLD